MKTRRIYISMPADRWLTKQENDTKWALVRQVESLKYKAEIFFDPRGTDSLSAPLAWSAVECERVMRRCDGCVILGFPRWRIDNNGNQVLLPTEFNHYEGAVAHTLGLPLLVLVQEGVLRRVVFDNSYKGYVGIIEDTPTPKWLTTTEFKTPFTLWRRQLKLRRDVFLGYCGSSSRLAHDIKSFLVSELDLRVLEWKAGFDPATTILEQIEKAAARCGAGIFLFTEDDALVDGKEKNRAAPRDNVVFEAGYFSSIKGKSRVLIVREANAKMPADLGGDIYAKLKSRKNIASIKPALRKFAKVL
jgi:hypothetical protein